ncbi:hypothetical protein EJ05DRAFT_499506 [Pseudovirgaria hyperparasitica]|uniref:Mitochondrial distribution and morphology protein 34 n=1 Tax=Pseudovirgaria hyperparasitica TaxID=470096 RepID=A0A6A6W8A1_9PEZI|nr:uncharacterized protein EJ05DRAFT_499506 [Pseudovirgaria hyperparasitica]KAF2759082.1 hypothetical protein EJ05DRAFT_499506 [Pseudovirgaria hyperparasitica]
MAFNFNWSPLIADTTRAKDMLTAALNKSPKPPIIVDDIIVTELNLGSIPPELEILEIGDLAEDRFRGIFKMSYTGDAFLTLKTRVQANPLNTYLSTKPSFASPQPLAAASSLTIPLSITLSDFRLSGFVILVFSRQKGLTLVFRNDPLESLKVSSTFDSIPFVRDYLQKEIEGQLRVLFMEDLPAILHRLSLRLFVPDYQEMEEQHAPAIRGANTVDPLYNPAQDPIDNAGNALDEGDLAGWSLDSAETHASFSNKNILRLAALAESQKTLSLFTPSIQGAVFRAWAGAAERAESSGLQSPTLTRSALSRVQSTLSTTSLSAPSISEGSDTGTTASRPSISGASSIYSGLGLGGGRSRNSNRKRKKRVINLRKDKTDDCTTPETPITPLATPSSAPALSQDDDLSLTLRPVHRNVHFNAKPTSLDVFDNQGPSRQTSTPSHEDSTPTYTQAPVPFAPQVLHHPKPTTSSRTPLLQTTSLDRYPSSSSPTLLASPSIAEVSMSNLASTGGILEQAWMMKMAKEIARKVAEERERSRSPDEGSARPPLRRAGDGKAVQAAWDRERKRSDEGASEAPPAYVA